MEHRHYRDAEMIDLDIPGSHEVTLWIVIGRDDGAPNFTMLLLEIAPEGHTPHHNHPWEEEVFVKSGSGRLITMDDETDLQPGDAVYIAPGEPHQFLNTGMEPFQFLCMIPHRV